MPSRQCFRTAGPTSSGRSHQSGLPGPLGKRSGRSKPAAGSLRRPVVDAIQVVPAEWRVIRHVSPVGHAVTGPRQPTCAPISITVSRDPTSTTVTVVGTTGFEPATPCSQSRCATKLRHVPLKLIASLHSVGHVSVPEVRRVVDGSD